MYQNYLFLSVKFLFTLSKGNKIRTNKLIAFNTDGENKLWYGQTQILYYIIALTIFFLKKNC